MFVCVCVCVCVHLGDGKEEGTCMHAYMHTCVFVCVCVCAVRACTNISETCMRSSAP